MFPFFTDTCNFAVCHSMASYLWLWCVWRYHSISTCNITKISIKKTKKNNKSGMITHPLLYCILHTVTATVHMNSCWWGAGAVKAWLMGLKERYMCVYIHELWCITPWEGFRGRSKGGAGVWLADVLCSRNTGAGQFNEQREAMWTKLPHLLPSHLWWVHFRVSSAPFTPLQDKWDSKFGHMESKVG